MREASNLNGFRAFSTKSPFSNQNLRKSSKNSQLSHQLDQRKSRHFNSCQRSTIRENTQPYSYSFEPYDHNLA